MTASSSISTEFQHQSVQSTQPIHTESEDSSKPRWWHYFCAGEVAGMCGSLLCHPFDTAKTKVQMLSQHNQSTLSFMRSLVAKDGFHALYRGVLYPFFGFGILFSISFGVNGIARNYFIKQNEQNTDRFTTRHLKPNELTMYQLMIGGVFAGAASSIFRTPIERVKCWSQIHHTSTARSTMDLLSRYGLWKGLWYGVGPTLTREVPQFAVYYPIYEATCALLSDPTLHGDKSKIEGWKIFASGASAGVGCWVVTYPIDVVKTRIQAAPPGTYESMIQASVSIYRQGGHRVFWNGLMPTIYRAAALHSAIFLVYERALSSIERYRM
eukprot:40316_1